MAEIPLYWRDYAAHQSNLNSRTSVDATSWGVEVGLNYLLEGDSMRADAVDADVDHVIASAARRDRYARSLLAKHVIIGTEVHDGAGQLEAKLSLALLQRQMPSDKLSLLIEMAAGTELSHLARRHHVAAGTLRTRVARARQIARDIAA